MIRTTFTAALAAVAFTVTGSSSEVRAQSFHHIDRVATALERQANELYREVRLHYNFTPQYKHLLSDVSDMARTARHIHEVLHHGASVHHLRHDVAELDRTFHHVEELFDEMEHYLLRRSHHGHHGHGHGGVTLHFGSGFGVKFGSSHFHRPSRHHRGLSHIRHELEEMEDLIHHLQDDLRHLH